jgi:hypothetical protein
MSIFIRITRMSSGPRFVRLRAPHTRFGLDALGAITFRSPAVLWGSLLVADGGGVLIPESASLRLNSQSLTPDATPHAAVPLREGSSCTVGDTTLHFFLTSPAAEALSETPELIAALDSSYTLEELPSVSYSLPSIGRSIPLFPGATYSIGSASSCALYLDLAGIAPHHGEIKVSSTEALIRSCEGGFDVLPTCGTEVSKALPCTIRLLPTGIPLTLKAGKISSI